MRPTLSFLSDELADRVVEEACRLLETRGVNLNHRLLMGRLADAGCRVDVAARRVWFTREVIDASIRSAPRRVRLWNIAGTEHCDLSGDHVHFTEPVRRLQATFLAGFLLGSRQCPVVARASPQGPFGPARE